MQSRLMVSKSWRRSRSSSCWRRQEEGCFFIFEVAHLTNIQHNVIVSQSSPKFTKVSCFLEESALKRATLNRGGKKGKLVVLVAGSIDGPMGHLVVMIGT